MTRGLTSVANTDVGKTLLTTALLRASASQYASNRGDATAKTGKGKRVFYLKPVSTGSDDEADVKWVLLLVEDFPHIVHLPDPVAMY